MALTIDEPVLVGQAALCSLSGNDEASALSLAGRQVKRSDDPGPFKDSIHSVASTPPTLVRVLANPAWASGDELTFRLTRGATTEEQKTRVV